jgi:exodeoxyribonuclease VII large subunit
VKRSAGPGLELEFDRPADHPGQPMAEEAMSVSDLTTVAKEIVEGAFPSMWVRGEVTDFKCHRNGHWYFCLRDPRAQVRAVVWSRDAQRLPGPPDDGMQVLAYGRLTVFAARGEMQFTVTRIEAEGDGLWRKRLEITRKRLEADGLLSLERKRALPRFPRTIAVITSADGAALRDITAVIERRKARVRVVLVPAAVQGDAAVTEMRRAIRRLARWGGADAVILARGGGGREDLWSFNDEKLARDLARCPVPTISAVGHETDITICDLVADLRAPTPSAAAEIVAPSEEELQQLIADLGSRMARSVGWRIEGARTRFRTAGRSLRLTGSRATERARARIAALSGRLDALSPLSTLHRGYAVPRDAAGRTLQSITDFSPEMSFELLMRDGRVDAVARGVHPTPAGREDT